MKTSFPYHDVYTSEHKSFSRYKGYSVSAYTSILRDLVEQYQPRSLLDYGCGKGYQYLSRRVHEQWGAPLPWCYDIGIKEFNHLPEEPVDGIICTDVMEHISKDDVSIILDHIFSLVNDGGFVFFGIACRPARKKFKVKKGTAGAKKVNVHLTVESAEWWGKELCNARDRSGKNILTLAEYDIED